MNFYVVTYTLQSQAVRLKSARRLKLYAQLKKSKRWWHYIDSTWIIGTNETADELFTRLRACVTRRDRLLIIEVAKDAERQGWLPKKSWEWFRR